MTISNPSIPDAILMEAPGCPYCPQVHKALQALVEENHIAGLEVINIADQPEVATRHGVRSVPWIQIGEFEFTGNFSLSELRRWALAAASPQGLSSYFEYLLTTGKRQQVEAMIRKKPERLLTIIGFLGSREAGINARVGAGAVLEELENSGLLEDYVDNLGQLTEADEAEIRADACHFLSLIHNHKSVEYLKKHEFDEDSEVREIVAESLESLKEKGFT